MDHHLFGTTRIDLLIDLFQQPGQIFIPKDLKGAKIRPNFVTWVSGAPLEPGIYIMHLRGTIKSADGIYLDCNGDGKGEGGSLPAYESKMHQVAANHLLPLDKEQMEELKDRMNK